MNKYILLSLIVTAAAFGAAHDDHNQLINQFKQAVEQVTPETVQTVLTLGAQLPARCKGKIAEELWLLQFLNNQQESNRINTTNKEQYMELLPAQSRGWTAIRNNNFEAVQDFINTEHARIAQERAAETARIEQEEAAARKAQAQEAQTFERLRDIKLATRKFTGQINRYSNAKTPDDREAVLSEICTIGTQLCTLDKTGFTTLTQEGTAFYNLVSYFMTHNNIHALRRIKYEIPNLHTSILSLIEALVTEHEDNSTAYRASQSAHNSASSSSAQTQIPTSSSYEPVLTSQENEMIQLQEMSEDDLANQMSLLPDNALAELLSSPNLFTCPKLLCDKITSAVLREQERRYNTTNGNIAPLPAENVSDTDDSDEDTRLAIEQSLLQEHSSEHDQPAIDQLQTPFNNEEDGDAEDLRLALLLSQTSPSASSSEQTEQPTFNAPANDAAPIIEAQQLAAPALAPTFGQQYRTPIIATGLTAAACALGAYLWNRYASQ